MSRFKQFWYYALIEPFSWMFYCIFQLDRLEREIEPRIFARHDFILSTLKRFLPMRWQIGFDSSFLRNVILNVILTLRLFLPLFLVFYSALLLIQVVPYVLFPGLNPNYYATNLATPRVAAGLLLPLAGYVAAGVAFGLVFGIFDYKIGVVLGSTGGIFVCLEPIFFPLIILMHSNIAVLAMILLSGAIGFLVGSASEGPPAHVSAGTSIGTFVGLIIALAGNGIVNPYLLYVPEFFFVWILGVLGGVLMGIAAYFYAILLMDKFASRTSESSFVQLAEVIWTIFIACLGGACIIFLFGQLDSITLIISDLTIGSILSYFLSARGSPARYRARIFQQSAERLIHMTARMRGVSRGLEQRAPRLVRRGTAGPIALNTAVLAVGWMLGVISGIGSGLLFSSHIEKRSSSLPFDISPSFVLGIVMGIGVAFGVRALIGSTLRIRDDVAICLGFWTAICLPLSVSYHNDYYLLVDAFLFMSYLIGSYRILLYPVHFFSGLKAYLASLEKRNEVFFNVEHSSLYWDERIYVPYPFLKRLLFIASAQDLAGTSLLAQITYIAAQRPFQRGIARTVARDRAIHELEAAKTLSAIARTAPRIASLLFEVPQLLDDLSRHPFEQIQEASKRAEEFCRSTSRETKLHALTQMTECLKNIQPDATSRKMNWRQRLDKVLNEWLKVVDREREKLEHSTSPLSIENPYAPGKVLLQLGDSLFVGRWDLARQLEDGLNREKDRRPVFQLNGESRMGKSSVLAQLPQRLHDPYIPLFLDLQRSGVLASVATFLGFVAQKVEEETMKRHIKIEPLGDAALEKGAKINDDLVYNIFEKWLNKVERHLEQEERMVLLAFDEFELLQGHPSLGSILKWFRTITNYHPCLTLLFSGRSLVEDIASSTDDSWIRYLGDIEMLRISFLKEDEAIQLITQPTPYFPGKQIFNEAVAEKVVCETACHPFLLQAVCAKLIDYLKIEQVQYIDTNVVEKIIEQSLTEESSIHAYFAYLWAESDDRQRELLQLMNSLGNADFHRIVSYSTQDELTAQHHLRTLVRRDLLSIDMHGIYQVAVPMFSRWLKRNVYH